MKYYPNEQMVDEEIAQAGKAAQLFEIEIEHMSGKRSTGTIRNLYQLINSLNIFQNTSKFDDISI